MAILNQILDTAEELVRRQGFNGFSYADIAKQTATSNAAIHYHFPKKTDLGLELIRRYAASEAHAMRSIEWDGTSCREKLVAYFGLYITSLIENKMCLCGIMGAEHETLTGEMQNALTAFFDDHVRWLARLLQEGCTADEFKLDGAAEDHAQVILSAMQGALMIAKAKQDRSAIDGAANALLKQLSRN